MRKLALLTDGWKRWLTYAWTAGILGCIRERGEEVLLFQYNSFGNWSHDEENNAGEYNIYRLPRLAGFDGVIVDVTNIMDEGVLERLSADLHACGLPVISLCAVFDDFYYVGVDNETPIRELMTHLYERHDCRTFAFLGGPGYSIENRLREQTYRTFLQEKGLPVEEARILSGDFDFDTGVHYMDHCAEDGLPLPDAFICANDNIAAGLCHRASELGFRVPEDFRVTGFDNLDKATYFKPQITTVNLEREKIAHHAMELMLELWQGSVRPRMNGVSTQCIYGESCGCPNSGAVDYRDYIKGQLVWNIHKEKEEDALDVLESALVKAGDFTEIFRQAADYFTSYDCEGFYVVIDPHLNSARSDMQFQTEGYDVENLQVAIAREDGEDHTFANAGDLWRHFERAGQGTSFIHIPLHFGKYAVGFYIFRNPEFLYNSPHLFAMMSPIHKAVEHLFKNRQLETAVRALTDIYNRDQLTGIYNRIAFSDILTPQYDALSKEGAPCAVLFADADHFKEVNDTYGHEYGDQVLKTIASALSSHCPEGGYVCRYGGDEFVALLQRATPEGAEDYRRRVVDALEDAQIAVSIGIVLTTPGDGKDLSDYVSMADSDMYRVKAGRRDARR